MIKVKKEILSTLTKLAETNDDYSAQFAAAIVRGNRVISFGYNKLKTHPFQAKYGRNEESIFLHAEIAAIKNALKVLDVEDLSKCDLYIVRVKRPKPRSKKYVWGLSKPCEGCMRAIIEFGIRRVIYSTDTHNEWKTLDCKEIK